MTITSPAGRRTYTESQLHELTLRFEIRPNPRTHTRRFYVDGVEVTEAAYARAISEAEREQRSS
jgi:hypothetical protein